MNVRTNNKRWASSDGNSSHESLGHERNKDFKIQRNLIHYFTNGIRHDTILLSFAMIEYTFGLSSGHQMRGIADQSKIYEITPLA